MNKNLSPNQTVQAQDKTVVYYDHYSAGHDQVIVIAHGFYNSKESVLLKELGQELLSEYDVIIMDFRGHGRTKGMFLWTAKEFLDLEAVLRKAHENYRQVGVIGFSLGAATSLITASKYDLIDSLIAVSAPVAFNKIEFHFWNLDFENDILYNVFGEGKIGKGVRPGPFWLAKDEPKSLVDKLTIPVHYIHGEDDWLIRPWHSQALYHQTQSHKKLSLIKQGPHAEYLVRKNKGELLMLIREWFTHTLIK